MPPGGQAGLLLLTGLPPFPATAAWETLQRYSGLLRKTHSRIKSLSVDCAQYTDPGLARSAHNRIENATPEQLQVLVTNLPRLRQYVATGASAATRGRFRKLRNEPVPWREPCAPAEADDSGDDSTSDPDPDPGADPDLSEGEAGASEDDASGL